MSTSSILPGAAVAAGLLWAALVSYVLLNRVRYDRLALRIEATLAGDGALDRALRRTTWGTLSRLVVDSAQPERLRRHAAGVMLARRGGAAVARDARRGRWFSRRWSRIVAWHVLYRTGGRLHPSLRTAVNEGSPALREAAVALLGGLADPLAAAILVEALRRGACAPACIAMQLDRFDAVLKDHALSPLLNDPQPLMRFWAIRLLSRDAAVSELGTLLAAHASDPDPSVRKAVAQAMGDIGGLRAAAVAAGLLADEVGFVRAHAVRALHAMSGAHREVALGLLLKPIMSDPDWWVRLAVREALAGVGAAPGAAEPHAPGVPAGPAHDGGPTVSPFAEEVKNGHY